MSSKSSYNYTFTVKNLGDDEGESDIREMWEEMNEGDPDNPPYGILRDIQIDREKEKAIVGCSTNEKQIADKMDGKIYNGVIT